MIFIFLLNTKLIFLKNYEVNENKLYKTAVSKFSKILK